MGNYVFEAKELFAELTEDADKPDSTTWFLV